MTNDWLDRYAHAVKSYLPSGVRNDVAEELLSDLHDECDYRAEQLGRTLDEDDVKTLLRERGHPMLVAADFQPRPVLISESVFPVYALLLRWVVLAIAIAQVCMALLSAIQVESLNIWQMLPQLFWNTLNASLYGFAWLTLIFYLFGQSIERGDFFKNWKPESLPKVTAEGDYISRTGSAIEAVVLAYFIAWINRIIPQSLGDNPIELIFSSQWVELLPWLNALMVASLILALFKLVNPYWTRTKVRLELALHIPTLILLSIIYQWESALTIVIGTGEHAKSFVLGQHWFAMALIGYAVFAAIDCVVKWRTYRSI